MPSSPCQRPPNDDNDRTHNRKHQPSSNANVCIDRGAVRAEDKGRRRSRGRIRRSEYRAVTKDGTTLREYNGAAPPLSRTRAIPLALRHSVTDSRKGLGNIRLYDDKRMTAASLACVQTVHQLWRYSTIEVHCTITDRQRSRQINFLSFTKENQPIIIYHFVTDHCPSAPAIQTRE